MIYQLSYVKITQYDKTIKYRLILNLVNF